MTLDASSVNSESSGSSDALTFETVSALVHRKADSAAIGVTDTPSPATSEVWLDDLLHIKLEPLGCDGVTVARVTDIAGGRRKTSSLEELTRWLDDCLSTV